MDQIQQSQVRRSQMQQIPESINYVTIYNYATIK